MARTLGDARDDVRDQLLESTAIQWSDTMLDRWINDALRDIARKAEVLLDRVDIAVTAAVQEYPAPTDTIRINRVEFSFTGDSNRYPLEYRDFSSMDSIWATSQSISQSTPQWWTAWGFPPTLKLILYPVPPSAGSLKVFYYRLPAIAASDTAVLELPNGWEDIVSAYCEYKALRRDADPRWQEAKQLYDEQLAAMMETTRRWTDQSGSVDFETGTTLPTWLTSGDW